MNCTNLTIARKVTYRTAGLLYSGAIGVLLMIMTSCGSDPPTEPPVIPLDTTGPVVVLTNPAAASSIGDTVTLQISSPDSLDIDRVEFRVDNLAIVGGVDSIAPYEFQWVAQNRTDGQPIEFSAQAFDKVGNSRDPDKVSATYRWAVRPSISTPSSDAIVGDTVTIAAIATGNLSPIAYVEFLREGLAEPNNRDSVAPFTYLWDASVTDTASANQFTVRAVDQNGNSSLSSAVRYHYLWRLLLTDPDEAWARDISTLSIRSTSTQLQFRVTTNGTWTDYRSEMNGLACAIFIDTDQNPGTGATGFKNFTFPINDIGADFRIDIGFFGDTLLTRNAVDTAWIFKQPLTIVNLSISSNDSVFELAIDRAVIGNPAAIDIVAANIFLSSNPISWDFAPDQGNGHVTYEIDGSFTPAPMLIPETFQSSDLERSDTNSQALLSPFQ